MTGRVLGIDYGDRRVGLALSDTLRTVATPLDTLVVQNPKQLFRELRAIIEAQQVKCVVVGHPLHMDGGRGALALAAEQFLETLKKQLPALEFALWDERLSSVEAERVLRHGAAKADRRKQMRDQLAALLILQSWLDARQPPGFDDAFDDEMDDWEFDESP